MRHKTEALIVLILHCFFWHVSTGVSVNQGRNVTLRCPLKTSEGIGTVSWYKQDPGKGPNMLLSYKVFMPRTVRYSEGLNPHRYAVLPPDRTRGHHRLRIINTEEKDTATYYCSYSEKMDDTQKMP